MPTASFSPEFLHGLIDRAEASPRRRQHHNVHADPCDPVQRLFNAVCPDSYIRPHRHRATARPELLLAVRGRFVLVAFDDSGSMTTAVAFGTAHGDHAGVELGPDEWHTVIALQPSVLFEVKHGPYRPELAKETAPWSPEEGSAQAADYLDRLRAGALAMLGRHGESLISRSAASVPVA